MDFIINWVDSNDPEWKKEYLHHKKTKEGDTHSARFRDWKNLKFWFRGVEKFAPWVNQIHFVTCGHLPAWLNREHPKLNLVNHKDFIPKKFLPTFNSRTIDLNFHRIPDLSEEYVYFNDDMFLINTIGQEDFFKNGQPCDMAISATLGGTSNYLFTIMKDLITVNRHFSKKQSIKQCPLKWFSPKYGLRYILKNALLYGIHKDFHTGFIDPHLPQAHLKSTLQLLWEKEPKIMNEACEATFRNHYSVNHYLQRYWELASNNFHPTNMHKLGKGIRLQKTSAAKAAHFIKTRKRPMVCINDHIDMQDPFEEAKKQINGAFEQILTEKSGFEI